MAGTSETQPSADRIISPLSAWAIAFGCAVGWGSFVMPGSTFLPKAGPLGTVIGVLVGGLIMAVIAANYHFMIQRKQGMGGAFAYAAEAFGIDHGFLCAWFLILTYVAIVWANATALTLVARHTLGGFFLFGFHYLIAGYDIWLGDILLSCGAIVLAAAVCCRRRLAGRVQTLLAVLFLGGIFLAFLAAIHRHTGGLATMRPAFAPPPADGGAPDSRISQVLRIVALAPWLFVGFEAISHSSGEFRFPAKKSFGIMAAALVAAVIAYALLALMPALIPVGGFPSWADYIAHLAEQDGSLALPTFATASRALGRAGVAIIGLTMIGAISTNLIGNTVTASRLLAALAEENVLPAWFGRTNRDGAPRNAILAIAAVSLLIPALGRTAIGFIVDVTTVGAAIAYAYTSGATYRLSNGKGDRLARATGLAGMALSVGVLLLFIAPNFTGASTIATESYLILVIWCMVGLLFYHSIFRRDRLHRFGNSTVVWITMLAMILFMSLLWVRSATLATAKKTFSRVDAIHDGAVLAEATPTRQREAIAEERSAMTRMMLNENLIHVALTILSLALLFSLYRIHRRRELEMEQEKAKAKSYFFSTMSHDIRTPLNAIIGYSQMLKSGLQTEAERKQAMDSILVSSNTLLGLVNDVLDLSKLESGRMEIHPEPTDVAGDLNRVMDSFRVTGAKPGVELRCRVGEMPPLMLDPYRLRQIVFNLVGNAVKFTEKGHVELRASFTREEGAESGDFRLEVEDTGIGIRDEDKSRIGDAYVQTAAKMSRNGGTGLGLAICRQLAAAAHGRMGFDSTLGKGSTFYIDIPGVRPAPAAPAPAPEQPAAPSSARPASPVLQTGRKGAGRHRRILIVDDAKINLMVLRALLLKAGPYEIAMANDGQEALKLLEDPGTPPFDQVLTDMWMPNLDGEGLVKAIRANPALASLRVDVITADVELPAKAAGMGFDSILLKPVTLEKLATILPDLETTP